VGGGPERQWRRRSATRQKRRLGGPMVPCWYNDSGEQYVVKTAKRVWSTLKSWRRRAPGLQVWSFVTTPGRGSYETTPVQVTKPPAGDRKRLLVGGFALFGGGGGDAGGWPGRRSCRCGPVPRFWGSSWRPPAARPCPQVVRGHGYGPRNHPAGTRGALLRPQGTGEPHFAAADRAVLEDRQGHPGPAERRGLGHPGHRQALGLPARGVPGHERTVAHQHQVHAPDAAAWFGSAIGQQLLASCRGSTSGCWSTGRTLPLTLVLLVQGCARWWAKTCAVPIGGPAVSRERHQCGGGLAGHSGRLSGTLPTLASRPGRLVPWLVCRHTGTPELAPSLRRIFVARTH
jgi:hypothetical protein